jgi:hypothetical protein
MDKLKTEIDVACPVCDSQPGEKCRYSSIDAFFYKDEFHTQRGDELAFIEAPQPDIPEEMIHKACEEVADKLF